MAFGIPEVRNTSDVSVGGFQPHLIRNVFGMQAITYVSCFVMLMWSACLLGVQFLVLTMMTVVACTAGCITVVSLHV